ncbi:MAG: DUF11 domain-containing protein [Leptolyngbya sp. SIO1E4]|nr:DUF11 domain-containing protein [Leptolyngbya sp. SIO1E4]
MPQSDWVASILDFVYACLSPLRRFSKQRFLLIFIAALLAVQLIAWGESFLLPLSSGSVYAQSIPNQAGANVVDPAGNPGTPIVSNETLIEAPRGPALTIIKAADRGAAEPGDVVVYRLLIRNSSDRDATPITVTDELPLGLQLIEESLLSEPFEITNVSTSDRSFMLEFGAAVLRPGDELSVVYAALVTPDGVRGSGRNVAQVSTPGTTSTATYQLAIRPGILADCGTIVGRVFVDKNFDGEQQPGEPGVPNAVLFMDDGNRILTDTDGLFSLANVLSGNRVGTLDLSSLPGYTLAPNLYRLSDNSQSRLVRLEPGGLARMNFGVTPAFGEEERS